MELEDENMEYNGRSDGKSGIFRVKIESDSHAYRYDVDINTVECNLVVQKDRTTQSAEKAFCFQIIKAACEQSEGFGVGAKIYAYDGRTILYIHKKIERLKIEIQAESVGRTVRNYVNKQPINVRITPHGDGDPNDISAALREFDGENVPPDRSIRTFIDVLVTHSFLESNEYYSAAAGVLYAKQPCKTYPGMQILVGLHKSLKFINNEAFLLLDLHRAQFYASCGADGQPASLLAVAQRRGNALLDKEYQGVRMELVHEEGKTFIFGSVTFDPVRCYETNGRALPDHYLTLGRKIDPNAFGVHPLGNNKEVFPLELVRVFAGQQWPPHKASAELENEVTPAERLAFIEEHARKLTIGSSRELFEQFGLSIDLESNNVSILHRKPPDIVIADATGHLAVITPQSNGSFFNHLLNSRLLATKHPPQKWICAHDPGVPPEVAWLIADKLAVSCQNAGLNLQATPCFARITAPDQLEGLFLPWSANPHNRFQFVLYVDSGRIGRLHDKLKLLETVYGIPTQKVSDRCLPNVKSGKNLVLKCNANFGGLNYFPIFDHSIEQFDLDKHPELLVIGYSVSVPERASPSELRRMRAVGAGGNSIDPAVVGLAANDDVVPYVFNSSVFYQNSSDDGIDREKLTNACKEIVKKKIANVNLLPTRLFVIRNSPSEDARVAAEIDAILEGWKKAAGECGVHFNDLPSVTVVVANKRHRQRFFRSSGTQCTNTQCGDVVAEKFVRTDTIHFFLQTHHSPRGQPKPTEYIVYRNQQQLPRRMIEQFVFTLAALHQSLASPSSLPLPAHLAEQTADQALQILREFRRLQSDGIRPLFAQQLQQMAGVFNVDDLNRLLAHSFDCPLGAPPTQ